MKILLSGGEKSENIVKALRKKFESSGDEIRVVKFIDEIESIFEQGEYFDKALICEQSITKDGDITDENELRTRINRFAQNSASRTKTRESYVFLTKDENLAEMISDETFPISENSAIVFKEPPYSVQFFSTILIQDARKINPDYIYKPKDVVSEINTVGDGANMATEQQVDFNAMSAPENFETAMMGAGMAAGEFNGYGLDTSGQQAYTPNTNANMEQGNGLGNNYGAEQMSSENGTGIISGEAPLPGFDDYDDNQQMKVSEFDNSQFDSSDNNGYLPGFDEEDYSNGNGSNDLYNGYTEDNSANNNAGFDSSSLGFDESDYMSSEYNNMGGQQGPLPGFDDSNYSDGTNGTMTSADMQGFNQTDYDAQNNTAAAVGAIAAGAVVANGLKNMKDKVNNAKAALQNRGLGGGITLNKVKDALKPFASRGSSIVVTGCGGCGTSTIAFSLANIISQIGYNVLLVDMDTKGRTQNYISRRCYDSMATDGANLMAAVNSSTGIRGQAAVVKQGFHLLTMGMEADVAPVDELLHKEKLNRFANLAKTSNNFVIYDVPFADATNFLADITYTADSLVLTVDASNWGVAKTMLSVCNIPSEDMQDVVFNRAQIVFNRYRNMNRVFGRKVNSGLDILKAMDKQVLELIGDDIGFHFEEMVLPGIINDDPNVENGWFEEVHFSDTKKGQAIFLELLYNIIMNRH